MSNVSPTCTGWRGCFGSAALAMALLLAGAASADTVDAVATPGAGALTMCRSWVVYNSCTTYNKVTLPGHVAVGDKIKLTYGSNPKDYIFHVVRIRRDGENCTVLSDASGAADGGEKLEVAPCQAAAKPASQAR